MWEEGVAQGVSKCNIEFKIGRKGGGGVQQNWIMGVGTLQKSSGYPPPPRALLKME